MSGHRAGRENVFAVCDVFSSEISETHEKSARPQSTLLARWFFAPLTGIRRFHDR
jgi:hypothetical protein